MSTNLIYRHKQTKIIVTKVCQTDKVFFTPVSPVANCVTRQEIPGWVVENSNDWKKYLFDTVEGVKVFEGDQVYYVHPQNFIINFWKSGATAPVDTQGYKYFISEDKAKEYVEYNKPQYSLFEIGLALTRYNLADHFIEGILKNIKTKNNG